MNVVASVVFVGKGPPTCQTHRKRASAWAGNRRHIQRPRVRSTLPRQPQRAWVACRIRRFVGTVSPAGSHPTLWACRAWSSTFSNATRGTIPLVVKLVVAGLHYTECAKFSTTHHIEKTRPCCLNINHRLRNASNSDLEGMPDLCTARP